MIEYRNATKLFGETVAVSDVSFEIRQGELCVFIGPSGCGKTTLLRLTNRLLSLTGGKILVDGNDIFDENPVKLRLSMGYAIQQVGLFPNKTIYDNIATVPKLLGWHKRDIRKRVDELLDMLRLDPALFRDRYPVELSGGQQQRIGVARCLAANPKILLMDEPFGAIDPINRVVIQNEFLSIQKKLKKTIAFVTHDMHEAITMGDKIAIFQDGRLIQHDTPETILTRPRNDYIADFVGTDRALKVLDIVSVGETMNADPENVMDGSTAAKKARRFLERTAHTHVVVVKDDKPVGYVTPERLKDARTDVQESANAYPVVVDTQTPLKDALSHMLMFDIRQLSVVDDGGALVGTITMNDIQKHILKIYAQAE